MTRSITKIVPGDDMHLTLLMAPLSLNLVVGRDREMLLAWGREVWQASRKQMHAEMGARFTGGTQRALTDEQEADVVQMRAQGIPFKLIMRKYPKVSRQTLGRIVQRRKT